MSGGDRGHFSTDEGSENVDFYDGGDNDPEVVNCHVTYRELREPTFDRSELT
jgi:hypothetical protein